MTTARQKHDIYAYLYSFFVLLAPKPFFGPSPIFRFTMGRSTNASSATVIDLVGFICCDCLENILSNDILLFLPASASISLSIKNRCKYNRTCLPDCHSSNIRSLVGITDSGNRSLCNTANYISVINGLKYWEILGWGISNFQ